MIPNTLDSMRNGPFAAVDKNSKEEDHQWRFGRLVRLFNFCFARRCKLQRVSGRAGDSKVQCSSGRAELLGLPGTGGVARLLLVSAFC